MSIVAKWSPIPVTAEHLLLVIISPAGAVAKYCDEYVCLCICLSVREDISGTTGAIFIIF